MNTVQPETQETWEGGAVSASPLPVSPSPTGRYPIDTVPREETTTSRSHLILPEILFPPRARLSGLSPCTARPLSQGAGGGRGSGRAVGVSHEYRSTRDTGDRGGGCSIPLPVSPSPTGRFPVDTAPRERFPSAGFRRGTPRRILFSPVARHPNYRHALPAPSEGGGRRP